MGKKTVWSITAVMLIYFTFTSGAVFEATKTELSGKMEMPYSLGLSAERTGIVLPATQDDIDCLNWLNEVWDGKTAIVGDYNTYCLITGHMPDWWYLVCHLRKGDLKYLPDRCYIFISSWNTRHQRYVEPLAIGVRNSYPLPEISYPLIKQCGDTKIYLKRPPSTGG